MFEKIKEKWNEKIQRNAMKSDLVYVTREGVKLMREQGIKQEDLPKETKVSEEVYFKRSLLPLGDWARIYPPINEDGKLNWVNLIFGGRRNLIKLLIVLTIIAMVFMQFYENFNTIEALRVASELCKVKVGLI